MFGGCCIYLKLLLFSLAGLTLDFAVSINPGVAVFVPIINGVGGNLVAVQASRISTFLHASRYPLGELPKSEKLGCLSPCRTFSSSSECIVVFKHCIIK